MCDLCRRVEAVPGSVLCASCGEAILRVAIAVEAMKAEAEAQTVTMSATALPNATQQYRAAFYGTE